MKQTPPPIDFSTQENFAGKPTEQKTNIPYIGKLFTRDEAARYLTSLGYPISSASLAQATSRPGRSAPKFTLAKRDGKGKVLAYYREQDLLDWVNDRLRKRNVKKLEWQAKGGKSCDPYSPKVFGNRSGSTNTITKEIKTMVLEALHGPVLQGVKYFEWLAYENSGAFAGLVGKIIPHQVNVKAKGDVRDLTTGEILAALAGQGIVIEEEVSGESGSIH